MTRDTPRDRIAAFLKQHRNRNGVDPERIMGMNMGTQDEAELRASDLDAVLAAPDLLAALEAMRDHPTIRAVCPSPLWAQMVNAILKARGENA